MRRELLGTNPDGSPHYNYIAEDGEAAVITGPIVANLALKDGTEYDVSAPVVVVPAEHHDELVHAIGEHYATNGHPDHKDGHEFVHTPRKKKG